MHVEWKRKLSNLTDRLYKGDSLNVTGLYPNYGIGLFRIRLFSIYVLFRQKMTNEA
jgi:hypothetical protein